MDDGEIQPKCLCNAHDPGCAQEEISSWKSKILGPPPLEQSKNEAQGRKLL